MPFLSLVVALLCWVQLFGPLRVFWASNDQYGYGWFVPLLAVVLLWKRRQSWPEPDGVKPAGQESRADGVASELNDPARGLADGGPRASAWESGADVRLGALNRGLLSRRLTIVFFCLALGLLLPFRLLEAANPGWIVLLWIHALLVLGISLGALRLWGGMSALRHYWFPLFFLLTCVPWPSKVDEWVTQGLQRGVARVTVEVVGLFSIPAVQHGSVLEISSGTVGIDEACSGIRSLQSSIMLALLLGELFHLRLRKRIFLLPSGILLALVANVGRTSLLTWSAAKQGMERMHAWHDPAGLAVVGTVMGGLLLLAWFWRERTEPEVRGQRSEVRSQEPEGRGQKSERHLPTGFLIFCCLWVPMTEGLNWTWYHWPGKGSVAAVPWTIQWPTNQSGFVDTPLPARTLEILRCTEHKNTSWTDEQGNRWSWIFMYWPPGQNLDIYVGGHNPEICMSGGGSTFLKKVGPVVVSSGAFSMRFNHRLFDQEHRLLHVFQGTWEPFVPPSGQRLFGDNSLMGRIGNVLERRLIRGGITLEIALSGPTSPEEAARLLKELMKQLVIETQPGKARRG